MSDFDKARMKEYLEKFRENSGSAKILRYRTGLEKLDQYLSGGLQAGLTVLGAVPSLGKTTLALQIAETIAKSGTPVIYYSLEVSAEWIFMKAVSRQMFLDSELNGRACPSANELRRVWTGKEEAILSSLEKLQAGAENLYIVTSNQRRALTAQFITDDVNEFIKEKGKRPVVFIDYLQLLSPDDKTSYQDNRRSTDVVIEKLSTLARGKNLPVFLISSLSRSSYDTPARMQDFKDSGSIEYSADVLLEMQMCAVREGKKSARAMKKSVRDVELVILKQRYGECGEDVAVRLSYYPKFNLFLDGQPEKKGQDEDRKRQRSFFINNSLVMNRIRKDDYRVGGEGNTDAETPTSFAISDHIDSYDCAILDAIYTLIHENPGKRSFHARGVYTLLAGDPKSVSGDSRQEIENRVRRMEKIRISIVHEKDNKRKEYAGSLLPVTQRGGDQTVFCFRKGEEMPLYQYAEDCRHFQRFPRELLQVTEADPRKPDARRPIRNDKTRIQLKVFLMNQIDFRRYKGYENMRYDAIFAGVFGKKADDIRERDRDNCIEAEKRILDYYKYVGYLEDYRDYGEGIELVGKIRDPESLEFPEKSAEDAANDKK